MLADGKWPQLKLKVHINVFFPPKGFCNIRLFLMDVPVFIFVSVYYVMSQASWLTAELCIATRNMGGNSIPEIMPQAQNGRWRLNGFIWRKWTLAVHLNLYRSLRQVADPEEQTSVHQIAIRRQKNNTSTLIRRHSLIFWVNHVVDCRSVWP